MLVTLIGENSIYKLLLPQNPVGNYWICDRKGDKERKLVNIEGKSKNWIISSNNYMKIIDLSNITRGISNKNIRAIQNGRNYVDQVQLKNYDMYGVLLGNTNEFYILYCSMSFDNNYVHLNIKNTKEILIGNTKQSHLVYNNNLINNNYALIFKSSDGWKIENPNSNFGIFVNSQPVNKMTVSLHNSDVIFIMGLKIIIMGNSIFINNPQNNVSCNNQYFSLNRYRNDFIKLEEDDEDEEIELYSEKDYFSRAPRITNIIERERVKIDAPPTAQNKEEMPAILVLGSTISMGGMMIVSMMSTLGGRISGTASMGQTVLSALVSILLLVSMVLFPILTFKYEKKKKKRYEKKRQERYKQYLETKSNTIQDIKTKQRNILFENYASAEECKKIIMEKSPRLWERKIEDQDFLSIRLGTGDVPLEIDIQYPEDQFRMEDDNLLDIVNNIGQNSKTLKQAPIVTSLVEKNISAIIAKNDDDILKNFIKRIIVQLIAFHSYEDLKIVFLLKKGSR